MFRFNLWAGLLIALWLIHGSAEAGPIHESPQVQTKPLVILAYCKDKVAWMRGVYRNRDAGVPMKAQIDNLWRGYKESKDPRKREKRFAWVDFERVIREAYRKDRTGSLIYPDADLRVAIELAECKRYGF